MNLCVTLTNKYSHYHLESHPFFQLDSSGHYKDSRTINKSDASIENPRAKLALSGMNALLAGTVISLPRG